MAKIAVIGGGAAGMMFSTQYKKMNPGDEIFIFEKHRMWHGQAVLHHTILQVSWDLEVLFLEHPMNSEQED